MVVRNFGHKPVFVPLWNDWTVETPPTTTYTGTVVKRDYWMKSDEFNLTTDLPHFPVRTISMKHVVTLNGKTPDQLSGGATTKTIKGSKGNEYVVTLNDGVAETCTCPGFKYHGGRCKHLALASAKVK